MTENEIRRIVHQVMEEERKASAANLDTTMMKTVSAILTSFGIEDDERVEIREDFRYLRRWRKSAEKVTGIGLTAVVTVIIGGFCSALWLGFKALLGK